MKHFSEFLGTRTPTTNRLGRIARTLTYEVEDKQNALDNAKDNLERLEKKIISKIENRYTHAGEMANEIATAKAKAEIWNNEMINSRITNENK